MEVNIEWKFWSAGSLLRGELSELRQWTERWDGVRIASHLAMICLPSLYVFACLSGSRARLSEIFGLVCGSLMLMTILLIGFAPVAWLFSQSTHWMGALHLVFAGIALLFGLRFLENGFSHSHARSTAGFNLWVIIFVLVVLQMTTALRPIVGTAETFLPTEKKFFISHWSDCLSAAGDRANRER